MRQEEAAKNNEIALICVEPYMDVRGSAPLLEGEIEGALVVYHTLLAGDTFELGMDQENLRTLVLVDGTVIRRNLSNYPQRRNPMCLRCGGDWEPEESSGLRTITPRSPWCRCMMTARSTGRILRAEYPLADR